MIFTSEAVSEGHPDKIADQISDAILDACLKINPFARVACEVFCCFKKIIISGEISIDLKLINPEKIARDVLKNIGYDDVKKGLNYQNFPIEILINCQSLEISKLVEQSTEQKSELGAGDQGIIYGYACNNLNTNYMPIAITIANELVKEASRLRKDNIFLDTYPDMKSQVTLEIQGKKVTVKKIALSVQIAKNIDEKKARNFIFEKIILEVLKKYHLNLISQDDAIITLFHLGGPLGDTGLTGRKIIADTYGGWSRHGGGAFSGKDGTKVDRSGAYMARYVAKNLVASGLLEECEIQVGYLIGHSKPVSISINTFNSLNYQIKEDEIIKIIEKLFNFSPKHMIDILELNKPIFSLTTCYGHFGKNQLPWEKLDMVKSIKIELDKYLKIK